MTTYSFSRLCSRFCFCLFLHFPRLLPCIGYKRLIDDESTALMRSSRQKLGAKERYYPTEKTSGSSFFVTNARDTNKGNIIPRIVWIDSGNCKGISTSLDNNIKELRHFNPNWKIIVHDCEQQRALIETFDHSLLRSYDLINSNLHAARSDVWRYAVLYKYGGVYIDTDVHIKMKLDDLIDVYNDSLVVAFEDVPYRNFYVDNYKLADPNLLYVNVSDRVCAKRNDTYNADSDDCRGIRWYKGKDYPVGGVGKKTAELILTQWMMFSKPQHYILKELLKNIVDMVHSEYNCASVINASYLSPHYPMQRLFSITGPWALTATVRHIIYTNASAKRDIRVVDGINFYKWYPHIRHDTKRRYFRKMKVDRQRLLSSYKSKEGINCSSLNVGISRNINSTSTS